MVFGFWFNFTICDNTTQDELSTTMNSLGDPMNEQEVQAMIAEADLDGDGKINFKEFQILMDNKEL